MEEKWKHAKRAVFWTFWEQSGQAGVEIGACWPHIYSDILQNAPFRSHFFKIFFASGGKGALNPLSKILRTFQTTSNTSGVQTDKHAQHNTSPPLLHAGGVTVTERLGACQKFLYFESEQHIFWLWNSNWNWSKLFSVYYVVELLYETGEAAGLKFAHSMTLCTIPNWNASLTNSRRTQQIALSQQRQIQKIVLRESGAVRGYRASTFCVMVKTFSLISKLVHNVQPYWC